MKPHSEPCPLRIFSYYSIHSIFPIGGLAADGHGRGIEVIDESRQQLYSTSNSPIHMSFAKLRQSRQTRQVSLAQAQSKRADASTEAVEKITSESDESTKWAQPDSFYQDLSEQFEIRTRQGTGRGVHAINPLEKKRSTIKSGLCHRVLLIHTINCPNRIYNFKRRAPCQCTFNSVFVVVLFILSYSRLCSSWFKRPTFRIC